MGVTIDFARIIDALATDGWSSTPDALDGDVVADLIAAEADLWARGAFRPAGTGEDAALRPEIRSDRIHWLDPAALPPEVGPYWRLVDALREEANRTLFLGLRGFEAHFAVYPPGAFYTRHLDQFASVRHRMISCLLYLNRGWTADDGGVLRLYPPDAPEGRHVDVLPTAGTFVCFRSDLIEHEVLPARRERFSLTGWLHREKVL